MKNLTAIALLLATSVAAQEAGEQAQETDSTVDSIAAEVFADDLVPPVGPMPDATAPDISDELDVTAEMQPGAEVEFEDVEEPAYGPPVHEQLVPVAEDEQPVEASDAPATETESVATTTVQLPPDASEEEQLIYEYGRYLSLMHDGVYDEADSVAKRVVELAIRVKGPKSTDFARALTNLAIVQHRTQQFDAARQNFQSAIEIIEVNEDRLNEQLINPLKGLGASQLEGGRPDLAADTFRRAVHVSHVNDGPHNLEQIELLDSLAEVNLRLGAIEEATQIQDRIYALNERAFADNALGMVPSLMRRADWQHRAGFINDERTTLRRVVRIIEVSLSSDDLQLIEPLMQLGKSFFFVDLSGSQTYTQVNTMTTGEIYFRRALRIASENPEADWKMVAETSLSLGDYYMFQGNEQRASRVYKQAWEHLSEGDEQLDYRRTNLEEFVVLRERPFPKYVSQPSGDPATGQEIPLLEGSIALVYDVSARGRATNLKIIEAQPPEFTEMQIVVQREMRSRVYRPRFVDGEPVDTEDQTLIHRFLYQQADLDALLGTTAAETEPESDST